MKQALIISLLLCLVAWTAMAAGPDPANTNKPSTSQSGITTAIKPSVKPLFSNLYNYLLYLLPPSADILLGGSCVSPKAILTPNNIYLHRDSNYTTILSNKKITGFGGIKHLPVTPTDRPKPHTQTSERAVPAIPDG
jgi:hypothetical protein